MNQPNLLVVCGPTASGKTSLAVSLAASLNGEIISADSRQVYRKLDIGSGKDLKEYTTANPPTPYHLIDIADPVDTYTIYHYQQDFYTTFHQITARGVLPVVCGGSGLYIESVLRGYQIPSIPENVELRNALIIKPIDELKAMLLAADASRYNTTDLSSKKRIVRAIEIATYSGDSPVPQESKPAPALHPVILCTRWDRPTLHERITRRLHKRIDEGMVDEVRRLRNDGVPDDRLLMLGMEYKFITCYLRGELAFDEMLTALRHSIFQLAKRQETYFRGMERRCGVPVHWIEKATTEEALCAAKVFFQSST